MTVFLGLGNISLLPAWYALWSNSFNRGGHGRPRPAVSVVVITSKELQTTTSRLSSLGMCSLGKSPRVTVPPLYQGELPTARP